MASENGKSATELEVRIYRVKDLVEILGISRTTIYRMRKREDFPRPVSLGDRAKGWLREDIEAWVKSRREE